MNSCNVKFLLCGFCVALSLGFSKNSKAGVGTSLMQVAPVTKVGEFEAKLQNDIIFNHGGGFNISPHLETGLIDPLLDIDGFFGTGTTDFQAGALLKFNLLPDVPDQIGLSFLGGYTFIHDEGINMGLFNLSVLASKRFASTFGHITPYGAFQFETLFESGSTTIPLTILLGSKWDAEGAAPWAFYTELSVSLRKSFYALSLGASYPF